MSPPNRQEPPPRARLHKTLPLPRALGGSAVDGDGDGGGDDNSADDCRGAAAAAVALQRRFGRLLFCQ